MAPTVAKKVGKSSSKAKVPPSPFKNRPVPASFKGHRPGQTKLSKSKKSDLIFNVQRNLTKLKNGHYAKKIRVGAAVYMTAVIEYLTAELLEVSGEVAKANKRVRIIPRHVMMGIKIDEELDKVFGDVTMPETGAVPFIHPVLLPKRIPGGKRSRSTSADTIPKSSSQDF